MPTNVNILSATIHLKMIKIAKCMLCVFYHNFLNVQKNINGVEALNDVLSCISALQGHFPVTANCQDPLHQPPPRSSVIFMDVLLQNGHQRPTEHRLSQEAHSASRQPIQLTNGWLSLVTVLDGGTVFFPTLLSLPVIRFLGGN